MRRRSEEAIKNAPPPRYYYVAVRDVETVEKPFSVMKRKTLDESEQIICKQHEITIYDDEDRKWRTVEVWRGAADKSWLCTGHPPYGHVPVLGYTDAESFARYRKAKEEAEKLWSSAEEILGQRVDVGQCIPDGRGACRRYASRLASFL
jgi:hypothetical protein